MAVRELLVAGLLLALLVPASSGQAAPYHVSDAPDDARIGGAGATAQRAKDGACRGGYALLVETCNGMEPLPVSNEGSTPAPPTLEAFGAGFSEDARDLFVYLELATIDEKFTGATRAADTDAYGSLFTVCWAVGEMACAERVTLAVMPSPGGVDLTSFFEIRDGDCNDFGRCLWRVPFTLIPGSPGRIEWRVPRELLLSGENGNSLQAPELRVVQYLSPHGRVTWPSEDGVGYGVIGPELDGAPTSASTYGYSGNHYVDVDRSEQGQAFTFTTARAAPDMMATFGRLNDPPGDVTGEARPDVDVLSLGLVESPTTFTVSVQVAKVEPQPVDHFLFGSFAFDNGRYFTWGYTAKDGLRLPYANVCAVPLCHREPEPPIRHLPLKVDIIAGSPGWINATFDRVALGEPEAGALVGTVDVTMFTYAQNRQEATPALKVAFATSGATDTLSIAPPWRFQLGTLRTLSTTGVSLPDPIGDVAANPYVGAGEDGMFDITLLEAVGNTPLDTRITIGLADVSNVNVPRTARAIFIGAAVELMDGRVVMAGYYREAQPGRLGADSQLFLCAQDTTVLTQQRRDPTSVVYATIQGAVSGAASVDVSGAGQTGAVILFVPHSCFGIADAGPLEVRRVAAGTFLIPAPTNELTSGTAPEQATAPILLDEALHDAPVTLAAIVVQPPGSPWYAEPFGIANFWDLLGVGTAAVASIVGVFAVRHKRRIVERYLSEIEKTVIEHDRDARAREAALLAIRTRLKADVLDDKVQQHHYSIIDKRLDETLAKARVSTLAEAFDELPARLLKRLQDMLHDGTMSIEDYRIFTALVEETDLTDAAKARIRRKLTAWVNQDAANVVVAAGDDVPSGVKP